jgi:hypothetical protein
MRQSPDGPEGHSAQNKVTLSPVTCHLSPVTCHLLAWLIPLAALLTLAGYFGAWVSHAVAGLAILGLDLGEYVKFLPEVRSGAIGLWREGFYLPLVAASLACSLAAFRAELRYGWPARTALLAIAVVAGLNLLPPAWTPQRMLTPEFHQQTAAILVCLGAVAFSPWLALLPRRATAALIALLALAAMIVPPWQFLAALPAIAPLYNHALWPGWGMYVMIAGLAMLLVAAGLMWGFKRQSAVET